MSPEELLQKALDDAFPAGTASRRLTDRVTALQPRPRPLKWYAFGATCAAASLAAAAFLFAPQEALASEVLRQVNSLSGHLTFYRAYSNGKRTKIGEGWTEGGKLREESDGTEIIEDQKQGVNVVWRPDGSVLFHDKFWATKMLPPGTVTPESLQSFVKAQEWVQSPKSDQVLLDGREVDRVTLTGFASGAKGRPVTLYIYADVRSHRVLGWDAAVGHSFTMLVLLDERSVPEGIFEPVFVIDGVKKNVYEDRLKWQDRLSKPVATYSTRGGTVTVRNVARNSSGDVFVLFTGFDAGYGNNVIPVIVSDTTGGRYHKGSGFVPSEGGADYKPFRFDGKPLEGEWFMRIGGGEATGPVTFGFRKEFQHTDEVAAPFSDTPDAVSGNVPPYMHYMGMPISPGNWKAMRLGDLASYHEYRKEYKEAESCFRQFIQLTTSQDPQVTMRTDGWQYYELSRVIEEQGRPAEALKIMRQAQTANESSVYHDHDLTDRISKAIVRLSR